MRLFRIDGGSYIGSGVHRKEEVAKDQESPEQPLKMELFVRQAKGRLQHHCWSHGDDRQAEELTQVEIAFKRRR